MVAAGNFGFGARTTISTREEFKDGSRAEDEDDEICKEIQGLHEVRFSERQLGTGPTIQPRLENLDGLVHRCRASAHEK